MILFKICILGEVAVGKTSLVRRFVDRTFSETYLTTVGVTISRRHLSLPAPPEERVADIQLVFWDLEGGQNFKTISSAYRKGAHGAIVVGDLTRQETIEALGAHIEQFLKINPASAIAVALNKSDLPHPVGRTQTEGWACGQETVPARYTSAKTGEGVDELITDLGARIFRKMKNGPPR